MSILRTRPAKRYKLLIVEPVGNWTPSNWQEKPTRFRIVKTVDRVTRLGKADAWKFMFNVKAIADGTACQRWALRV